MNQLDSNVSSGLFASERLKNGELEEMVLVNKDPLVIGAVVKVWHDQM